MTQASNLANAINKLMESKLDSSLREKYFVINQAHWSDISLVQNLTTGKEVQGNIIFIGADDIIRINYPAKEYTNNGFDNFEGTISEAIEEGYVKGNFIFSYLEPQDTQVETGQG